MLRRAVCTAELPLCQAWRPLRRCRGRPTPFPNLPGSTIAVCSPSCTPWRQLPFVISTCTVRGSGLTRPTPLSSLSSSGAFSPGQQPTVHGDGRQSRDFTFVDDVIEANLAAAGAPADVAVGRVLNIACGGSHSLLELLDVLGREIGVRAVPAHVEPRPGDIRASQADVTAARHALGFEAKVTFEDGLRRTVELVPGGQRFACRVRDRAVLERSSERSSCGSFGVASPCRCGWYLGQRRTRPPKRAGHGGEMHFPSCPRPEMQSRLLDALVNSGKAIRSRRCR